MRRLCAWCRKDMDTGQQLTDEEYARTCTLEAEATHGICPECAEELKEESVTMEKWKVRKTPPAYVADNNTEIIIEGSGAAIAKMDNGWDNPTIQANAERIVKAVNSYDAMYAALKVALDFFTQYDIQQKVISGISLQLNEALAEGK